MLGIPTIYEPVISSMCNSPREGRNQNILFITWRIFSFFFDSLPERFIFLCGVSMIYSFGVLLLVGSTSISQTISGKASFLITCITSEFRYFLYLLGTSSWWECSPLGWRWSFLNFLVCVVRDWSSLPIFSSRDAIRDSSYEHSNPKSAELG